MTEIPRVGGDVPPQADGRPFTTSVTHRSKGHICFGLALGYGLSLGSPVFEAAAVLYYSRLRRTIVSHRGRRTSQVRLFPGLLINERKRGPSSPVNPTFQSVVNRMPSNEHIATPSPY